jgi:formylglycine-generating enzyme required for sulfatase activity
MILFVLLTGALAAQRPTTTRSLFDSREGHTMVVVQGPVSVLMGSPANEPGRQPAVDAAAEPQHMVTIPHSFAIGSTEVTVGQFRRFLEANPDAKRDYQFENAPGRMEQVLARFSPDDDGPAIAMTWYEAAMYCNWLSAREGLASSEWVYPAGALRDGFELPANYLHRRGYRLPTEPEWEFAARAGSSTSRFFGNSDAPLGEYAWFSRHPPRTKDDPVDPADPQRTAHVGLLKPNPLGLFDIYGNVWEWTQDRVQRFQTPDVDADREDTVLRVSDRDPRTRRGGAFPYGAAFARSAARGSVNSLPTNRRDNVGFRVARTLP